jgi:hypothetical protein
MASRLPTEPLWIGRRRGTNLSSLVAFPEPEPEPDRNPFLKRLGNRLFNAVGDGPAGVIGFLTTLNFFMSLCIVAANVSVPLGVVAVLATVAWCFIGVAAGYLAHARGDQGPDWARGLVAAFVVIGKVTVVIMIVVTVIVLLYMLLAIIVAGRDR